MEQKSYEANDVVEGLLNIIHALVAGLDETRAMPSSTSVTIVRSWADIMDNVPPGAKRFMHDAADIWELEQQASSGRRPRFFVIPGGKQDAPDRDDDSPS